MWPDDRDLPVEVEAAFGADLTADPGAWSWTDLSSRLRDTPISVRVPSGQLSPGTCSVTLDNDDGALTPLQPLSPYWPNVELGTPLRVRVRRAEDAFARTVSNGWGTADSGQAWTVSTGPVSAFSTSAGVASHSHGTVNALRRVVLDGSLLNAEQVVDVAPSALLTGAALVTGLVFRYSNGGSDYYWLRCEFNSAGTSVMLKISKCVGGGFTDLAVLNPVPGLAYAPNTYLRVRASVVGSQLAMKAWNPAGPEPAGWQVTATDTDITVPGGAGTQSWLVLGNTNTLPVVARHKNYALRVDRFAGYADQWEPTYLPTGVVGRVSSAVRVTCSGILRRLTQGTPRAASAMRRTIGASGVLAYWPVEDGTDAGQVASALPGHQPLAITGTASFSDIESWTAAQNYPVVYGTAALADLSKGASLRAAVPPEVTAGTMAGWTLSIACDFAVGSDLAADFVLAEVDTPGGTFVRWRLVFLQATTDVQLVAYNAAGAGTVVFTDALPFITMVPHNLSVWQSGGTIQAGYIWDSSLGYEASGSVAGTLTGVTAVTVNPTGATATVPLPVGHIALWAGHSLPVGDFHDGDVIRAMYSWSWTGLNSAAAAPTGEPAAERLVRLCAEDALPLTINGSPEVGSAELMGPQPVATFGDLMQECVDVDGGVLYESGFGLGYLPRTARYNRPAVLTADLSTYAVSDNGGDVLDPVYDDQDIRNRWTVERRHGSSVVVDDPDSQRRGVYTDSVELNLASDAGLLDQAGWRLHLTTVVDLRESTFPIDLAANPDLVDGWLSCGVGSRIVRTNPPAPHRPGDLDRLVEGWTETIGPRSWTVQVTPSPASPWDVATVDGDARVAGDGSTLAAAVTEGQMTLSIASPHPAAIWTTDPADFPLDLRVGAERVTVSAITGTSSPQTATVTARGVNGVTRAWPAGTEVDVWQPAVVAL